MQHLVANIPLDFFFMANHSNGIDSVNLIFSNRKILKSLSNEMEIFMSLLVVVLFFFSSLLCVHLNMFVHITFGEFISFVGFTYVMPSNCATRMNICMRITPNWASFGQRIAQIKTTWNFFSSLFRSISFSTLCNVVTNANSIQKNFGAELTKA